MQGAVIAGVGGGPRVTGSRAPRAACLRAAGIRRRGREESLCSRARVCFFLFTTPDETFFSLKNRDCGLISYFYAKKSLATTDDRNPFFFIDKDMCSF